MTAAKGRLRFGAALAMGLAALVLSAGLSACGPREPERAKPLRIYNWTDYIDPALLEEFTRETGIKVEYETFDSNEALDARVLAGDTGFDIVTPSSQSLPAYIAARAIVPLDLGRLPGRKNLWPEMAARMEPFDPGGKYAIPYMWGTVGIGYNKAEVEKRLPGVAIDSWDVVFNPANLARLRDCGVYFLDAPEDMFSVVLNYMGRDPNTRDMADYAAATELLMRLRPYVARYDASAYVNALADGEACVVIGFSGDVLQAATRAEAHGDGDQIAYVIPKEGSEVWFDVFTIPADAPNKVAAHQFLDFMLRPDVIARASNYTRYANANSASTPLVDRALLSDPTVYPTPEVNRRLFVIATKDDAFLKRIYPLWSEVTKGL